MGCCGLLGFAPCVKDRVLRAVCYGQNAVLQPYDLPVNGGEGQNAVLQPYDLPVTRGGKQAKCA